MLAASAAFREFRSFFHRELCTLLNLKKVVAMTISVAVCFAAAYGMLAAEQVHAGGQLLGSTAWDVYYAALNNKGASVIVMPAVCLYICGDIVAKDRAEGLDAVLLVRSQFHSMYYLAKIITVFIACFGVVFVHCALLTAIDVVISHTTLRASAVPGWLAYSGGVEWFAQTPAVGIAAIPSSWNYGILLAVLVLAEAVKLALISLFFIAVCRDTTLASMPFIVGVSTLLVLDSLPILNAQLRFLFEGESAADSGVALTGFVADRLYLGSYALGASFGQSSVGSSALLESLLLANEGLPLDAAQLEMAATGRRVNSYAGYVLLLCLMACFIAARMSRIRPYVATSKRSKGPRLLGVPGVSNGGD